MKALTPHEQIATKSRKEIERISFLIEKFSKDCKLDFQSGFQVVMAKAGYIKYNYLPCDNEDLFFVSQLCIKYMRIYAIRELQFTQIVLNTYDYCKINGYSIDVEQTTLKV